MKQFTFTIKDEIGLHARPAGQLVKLAQTFPCKLSLEKNGKSADLKRLFALMALSVKCGESITVSADGENEEEAAEKLKLFLEENL